MHTYSPAEFLSKLSTNELPDPGETTICGLARADEKSSSVIQFSISLSCEKWLSIPIEIVESVDHLKTIACKDHQHPLVKIKFKRLEEARPDVAFFLQLLSEYQSFISRSQSAAQNKLTDCVVVHTPNGLEVCCWQGNEIICTGIV